MSPKRLGSSDPGSSTNLNKQATECIGNPDSSPRTTATRYSSGRWWRCCWPHGRTMRPATPPPKETTVHRFSPRQLLSLAASMPDMKTFTRDVTQAYVQSETMLDPDVYISAPPEMQPPPESVLKVLHPLYGSQESGLQWYLTYTNYHIEHLGLGPQFIHAYSFRSKRAPLQRCDPSG